MNFLRATLAAGAITVVGVVSGFAADKQASAVDAPCSDSCDLAAHNAALKHSMAMDGQKPGAMSDMSGMQGMATSQPAARQPQPQPDAGPSARSKDTMSTTMMMHGGHMMMTSSRPANAADAARADEILRSLRKTIEPYTDYRVAEAAGYKQFLPRVPQEIYHFTNWQNALANEFSFDPARPTSLMYKRVPSGYELVGVMYTAPRQSTLDQLNERVPLSVVTWHLHVNFCQPPPGADSSAFFGPNAQFGLAGLITSQEQCTQAGGTFKPSIYNWMVHVWPFETDRSKVWATEDHPGAMNH